MTRAAGESAPALTLARPMPASIAPAWPGALWVGQVEHDDLIPGEVIHLSDATGFGRARLLVRDSGRPRGFVEVPVQDGQIDADAVLLQADHFLKLPASVGRRHAAGAVPPISVVVCTRDRPDQLRDALGSLARLDYPDFEVLVVDNNPYVEATRAVVAEFAGALPARVVNAPLPGLARARNVGVRAAQHDIVAFTDDDVLVDPNWLSGIARGFAAGEHVGCVTGMVASGELNSLPQWYFDRRVTWARNCNQAIFSIAAPPETDPLFPFRVGSFGTGANFALRRGLLYELGGFDEGLGAGSPTGGGEDIDMFVRVLRSGAELHYLPEALIWHRHRSDMASLTDQSRLYGRGLGAWLTKLVLHPSSLRMVLVRAWAGLRHLRSVNDIPMQQEFETVLGSLGAVERRGVLTGPVALLRARLQGRAARPMRGMGRPVERERS